MKAKPLLLLILLIATMSPVAPQLTEEESLIAQWFSRSQDREDNRFDSSHEDPKTNWIPVKGGAAAAATTDYNWTTE